MNERNSLLGQHIKVQLKTNGHIYRGTCVADDEHFISLVDVKLQRKVMCGKSDLSFVEVRDDE